MSSPMFKPGEMVWDEDLSPEDVKAIQRLERAYARAERTAMRLGL